MRFGYPGERQSLDSDTRRPESGDFVSLASGVSHYELGGPPDGRAIVLICGFSVPYYVFDPVFDTLCAAGLRVLRFDLLGRGWSDRPQVRYSLDLFVRQLRELLEALDIARPTLVGLSMGGPIAAAFTSRYPAKVEALILIDPAGARDLPLSMFLRLLRMPGIGELAMLLLGTGAILRAAASDFFDRSLVREFLERYQTQMQYVGFRRTLLSTVREGMLDSFLDMYEQVAKLGHPTLIIWGTEDRTVPFEHSQLLRAAIPHAVFREIPGAGHLPHHEQPALVNRLLLEFLK